MADFRVGCLRFTVVTLSLGHAVETTELTPSEHEVAALATQGLSNLAIARCRGTAGRTVANQMASILRKLGVQSRYQLAARFAADAAARMGA